MNKKLLTSLLAISALGFGSANAVPVFSDDFNSYPSGTVEGDAGFDWGHGFNTDGGVAVSVADGTTVGFADDALRLQIPTTLNANGVGIGLGSTYTLTNIGDKITLSFQMSWTAMTAHQAQIRYGFFTDADGTIDHTADQSSAYWGQISTNTTDRGRIVQSTSPFDYGTDGVDFSILISESVGPGDMTDWAATAASTVYTFSLSAELTAGGVLLTNSFSGAAGDLVATDTVASDLGAYTSFDSIGFGFNQGGTGIDTYFDNVTVDFTPVPEPSTYALLAGFGALGLVMLRRRLRS